MNLPIDASKSSQRPPPSLRATPRLHVHGHKTLHFLEVAGAKAILGFAVSLNRPCCARRRP